MLSFIALIFEIIRSEVWSIFFMANALIDISKIYVNFEHENNEKYMHVTIQRKFLSIVMAFIICIFNRFNELQWIIYICIGLAHTICTSVQGWALLLWLFGRAPIVYLLAENLHLNLFAVHRMQWWWPVKLFFLPSIWKMIFSTTTKKHN